MPVVYAVERISESVWILWVIIFLSLGISASRNVKKLLVLFLGLCNFFNIFEVGYGWLFDLLFDPLQKVARLLLTVIGLLAYQHRHHLLGNRFKIMSEVLSGDTVLYC